MLRILSVLLIGIIISACNNKKPKQETTPGELFIQSLKENKFEILEPGFADKDVYKAVAVKKDVSDAYIDSFLIKNKERLKEEWGTVAGIIKEKGIDLSKLKIKEWLVYNPFKDENKNVQGGVLVYEFEGKTWDDLMFIVGTVKGKTYILEIPNPTRMFSFSDTSLRNVSDARLYTELADTAYVEKVKDRVKELIGYAKENKIELVTTNAVYAGEDETRRWKTAMNPSESKEFEAGDKLVKQINSILESCTEAAIFDRLDYERESEGVWVVQKMKCGKKNIYFAFLKVNGQLLLGEVNADELGQ